MGGFLVGAGLIVILVVGIVALLLRRKCKRSSKVALQFPGEVNQESSPGCPGMAAERDETVVRSYVHQECVRDESQQTSSLWRVRGQLSTRANQILSLLGDKLKQQRATHTNAAAQRHRWRRTRRDCGWIRLASRVRRE